MTHFFSWIDQKDRPQRPRSRDTGRTWTFTGSWNRGTCPCV